MPVNAVPAGYHTVTPYLLVRGAERLIRFLQEAFGAEEIERVPGPSGRISHAEVKIGDSVVMMGEPSDPATVTSTMLYLYLEDVDKVYARALRAGGTSVQEPKNEFYGDRTAAVEDHAGNKWYIATHVEDVPTDELARRAAELAPTGVDNRARSPRAVVGRAAGASERGAGAGIRG
ncbi:MAG: VOC family protein [Candidatus Limnocylindria bacterium]